MILRKGMAVIAALAVGVGGCPIGITAEAAQKEEIKTEEFRKEDAGYRQGSYILDNALSSETDWDKAYEVLSESVSDDSKMDPALLDPEGMKSAQKNPEKDSEKTVLSGDVDDRKGESAGDEVGEGRDGKEDLGAKTLQMPQKLEVMIDPWEVDGKGQIYSEQYVIRNTGDRTGVLTLSGLTCRPQEGSGVSVVTDRGKIRGDGGKSIYMEMVFGTGERIVLSEDESEYKTELGPGEEVTLEFAGEVNEHASGKWDNSDVAVGVVYSWKLEEETADVSEDAGGDVSGDISGDASGDAVGNVPGDVTEDVSGDAVGDGLGDASGDAVGSVSGDVSGDVGKNASGDISKNATEGTVDVSEDAAAGLNVGVQGLPDGNQKKEPRIVDIERSKDAEFCVDSWTEDGNGNIISVQYVMRNTGNVPGTLKLSDPVCKLADESGIVARMKMNPGEKPWNTAGLDDEEKTQDAEGAEHTGKKYIWFELALEDEEKSVTGQENLAVSEYETELEPGEELIICFCVSSDEIVAEEMKGGKAVAAVKYSWETKEEAASGL